MQRGKKRWMFHVVGGGGGGGMALQRGEKAEGVVCV